MLICLIYFWLSSWDFTSALKFEKFHESAYASSAKLIIPTQTVHEFSNLKSMLIDQTLENRGGCDIHAQPDAAILINQIVNYRKSWFAVQGLGSMDVRSKGLLINGPEALFSIVCQEFLRFSMDDLSSAFINDDKFILKATNGIKIDIARTLTNNGGMEFVSMDVGRYFFGTILNSGAFRILSQSQSDFLTFGELSNDGSFYVSLGSGTQVAIQSRGTINNAGKINFCSLAMQSVFEQNEKLFNDELICLQKTIMLHSADVYGIGCFSLKENSAIAFNLNHAFHRFTSVLFIDGSSYIVILQMGVAGHLVNLYGVTSRHNFIRSLHPIDSVIYNSDTGILKVFLYQVNFIDFNLGLGYVPSSFMVTSFLVTYVGAVPPPRDPPSQCRCEC